MMLMSDVLVYSEACACEAGNQSYMVLYRTSRGQGCHSLCYKLMKH